MGEPGGKYSYQFLHHLCNIWMILFTQFSGSSLKRSCYGAKSGRLSVNVDNSRVFREQVIWKPAEKGRSSKSSKDDGQAKGEFLQMQSQEPGDCKADCQSSNLFERDNAGGAASVGGKHNTSYAAANGTGLSSGKGETLIEIGGNPEPDAPSVDDIDLARAGNIDLEAPGPIDQDHEEGGNDGPDPPRRGDDGPDPPRRGNDGPDPPRSSRGLTLLVGASWLVDLQLLSTIGNLKSGGSSTAKDILCYMLMPTLAFSFFFTLGGKLFRSSKMLRIGVSLTALSFLVTMVVAVL